MLRKFFLWLNGLSDPVEEGPGTYSRSGYCPNCGHFAYYHFPRGKRPARPTCSNCGIRYDH